MRVLVCECGGGVGLVYMLECVGVVWNMCGVEICVCVLHRALCSVHIFFE